MKVYEPAPPELWDQVCEEAEDATFFHTRAWTQVLSRAYPEFRDASRLYVLDDGTMALLPLMVRRGPLGGLFRYYESNVAGTYGGVIANGPLTQSNVDAIYSHLKGPRVSTAKIEPSPFATALLPRGCEVQTMFSQVLRLSGDYDETWRGFSRGHKSSINKAARSGMTVELGDSEKDYVSYYATYEDAVRRWGDRALSHHPLRMFLAIRELATPHAKLWLVKQGGTTVAGILNFNYKGRVFFWSAGLVESASHFRPSNLVHAEAIRHACEAGYKYYDFGHSGPNAGVEQFKAGFGPVEVPMKRGYFVSPLRKYWRQLKGRSAVVQQPRLERQGAHIGR